MWEVLERLGLTVYHATGSRYICNPPVLNTDDDMLVFTDCIEETTTRLILEGWSTDSSDRYPFSSSSFKSFRKGIGNIILTGERQFFNRFLSATILAKYLNLLNKVDRVALFASIIGAEAPALQALGTTEPDPVPAYAVTTISQATSANGFSMWVDDVIPPRIPADIAEAAAVYRARRDHEQRREGYQAYYDSPNTAAILSNNF